MAGELSSPQPVAAGFAAPGRDRGHPAQVRGGGRVEPAAPAHDQPGGDVRGVLAVGEGGESHLGA